MMDQFTAWLFGILAAIVPGIAGDTGPRFNGYVEIDYVYVAPLAGGRITHIAVAEGQRVAEGDVLVSLDTSQQQAALAAAEAQIAAAEAALRNLETGGREDEIAVARANLMQAEADLKLAQDTADRSARLFDQGIVAQSRRDQDQTALNVAKARVAQLAAQLKVIELPARDAQQQQAEANLAAAEANAEAARIALAEREVLAPADGQVEKLFYSRGEIDGAGVPLLSLRPEGALKVKFYLPEAARSAYPVGTVFTVACDGCSAGVTATLSYLAADPQFTPPVIYSRDERQRLSFLAEAEVTGAVLPPGQPVTLEPMP
jgi:HlyD family secretion protein